MKKRYLLVTFLAVLVACGDSGLANQAVKEAREAFEDGSYQEGVGFLKLATDESSNKKYQIWHEQGEALLKMVEYDQLEDLDKLLLAWTDLNLVDSQPSFVKDEAINYERSQLNSLEEKINRAIEAEKTSAYDELIALIRFVEKRMGSLKLFRGEIETLIALRDEMEGLS